MRKFEKISFEEFSKYYKSDKKLYEEYILPKRMTSHSAGYDFFAIDKFTIKPGEIKKMKAIYLYRYKTKEIKNLLLKKAWDMLKVFLQNIWFVIMMLPQIKELVGLAVQIKRKRDRYGKILYINSYCIYFWKTTYR